MRSGFDIEVSGGDVVGRLYRAAPAGTPRGSLVSQAVDDRGRTCLFVGRLLYRRDLVGNCPALAELRGASDAELVLALFAERGPAGLARLEGEFGLVLHDPATRSLYALRDLLGSWPLYWMADQDRLCAGTSLLDLARRLGSARVNLDYLGQFLMCSSPHAELPRDDTALEPIQRVPPGRLLRLGGVAGPVTLHEHAWTTPDKQEGLDLETAGQRFRELFVAAVRERLGAGRTVAHLSGGMDSSAVVCVARDLLKERGDDTLLDTLSMVYDMPSLAGETAYIDLVRDQGPLAAHFLDGDELLGFDWFSSDVPEHDEPYCGLNQLAIERGLTEAAKQTGATTVLTGCGAEVVAEGLGYDLADLVVSGRPLAALRQARARATELNTSLLAILKMQVLAPLLPAWLRDGPGTLLRRGWSRWPWLGQSSIPPWVRPIFARRHGLWQKGRSMLASFHRAPYEDTAVRFMAESHQGDWSGWHLASRCGMHTGRPFLDPRLLAFSLSLPHHLRYQVGVAKPLLQSAMKGILPEPIRTRLWKRGFNDPYRLGLSRRLEALEDMVLGSRIAELDMLDLGGLRTALHQVAAGLGPAMAGVRLDNTLSLVAWYDHLGPALARPADEPSEVLRYPNRRRTHAANQGE
jgi:asparagine synthase (glutamine-hydrolysing)